ncbi:MAG: DUF192 domain-containing protein [Rhizobiaceae bacterium]|nr:DUF192 domain-containing protein [Rhizobiaceae bacterium]
MKPRPKTLTENLTARLLHRAAWRQFPVCRNRFLCACLTGWLILFACQPFISPATADSTAARPTLADDPLAVLPVEELEIVTAAGSFRFSVEIADEADERSTGLMHRPRMLPTHGMLFDFGKTGPVMMWMENTPLSLDMVFIRSDGTIARIARNTTPFSRDIVSSGEPVSHVLELNAGMATLIGLKSGDRVRHRMFR